MDRSDDRVLAAFQRLDGTLHTIPTKRTKRLIVLDHLAQSFEPGRRYTEVEVNQVLERAHPDYAALRRYWSMSSSSPVRRASTGALVAPSTSEGDIR